VGFLTRLVAGGLMVRRVYYRPSFQLDWKRLRGLIAQGAPFGLAMFGILLYARVGVFMLKGMSDSADVALFNIGYMLSQPLGFISSALNMSAFPVLSRYAHQRPEAVRHALRQASKYQLLVTFPVTVGLYLLADRVVPLLLKGADFARAALVLETMILALTFVFLNLMSRYVLTALDRQRVYMRAVLVGLVVNTGLCAFLIPRLGVVGACLSFVGAELAILIVCQRTLSAWLSTWDLMREGVKPLIAALLMGVVVVLAEPLPLVLLVGLGVVVYGGTLLALRAFTPRELDIVRRVYVSFRLPGSALLSRGRTTAVTEG
jgi:O-antigen/teichoic acid export membrane protein